MVPVPDHGLVHLRIAGNLYIFLQKTLLTLTVVLFQQPAGKLALNPGASAERAERTPGMFLSLASFPLVLVVYFLYGVHILPDLHM